jgi:hypothetical protein
MIEDDKPDNSDAELEAETITGAVVESGCPKRDTGLRRTCSAQDLHSESSDPNIWYDVEEDRCVDKNEPLPNLGLEEQDRSFSPTPIQNRPCSPHQSPEPITR